MNTDQIEQEIVSNYTTPGHPTAFGGISKVGEHYQRRKKFSQKKLKNALSSVESYNLHRGSKQLTRNPTFVHHKRQQIQVRLQSRMKKLLC